MSDIEVQPVPPARLMASLVGTTRPLIMRERLRRTQQKGSGHPRKR
jgi:hypothetical protein